MASSWHAESKKTAGWIRACMSPWNFHFAGSTEGLIAEHFQGFDCRYLPSIQRHSQGLGRADLRASVQPSCSVRRIGTFVCNIAPTRRHDVRPPFGMIAARSVAVCCVLGREIVMWLPLLGSRILPVPPQPRAKRTNASPCCQLLAGGPCGRQPLGRGPGAECKSAQRAVAGASARPARNVSSWRTS